MFGGLRRSKVSKPVDETVPSNPGGLRPILRERAGDERVTTDAGSFAARPDEPGWATAYR